MELVDKKEYSKPTFLSVFVFACYAILALCANEFGLGYNGVSPTNDYLYYGYGSVILSIILGISLIVIFTRKLGLKNNYFFLIATLICFIGDGIALFSFPSKLEIDSSFSFVSPISFRIYLLFAYLSLAIFIYSFYTFLPLLKKGKKSFNFVFEIFVIVSLLGIIISYIIDFNDYVALFKGEESFISSLFGHKNIFGLVILFGVMSTIYLFELDKKKWRIFFFIFLLVSSVPVNSKSSIVAEAVLIFSYMLYKGFTLFKTKKKLSITLFSIVGVIFLTGIILLCIPIPEGDGLFRNLLLACKSIFSSGEGTTIGTRFVIYKKLFNQLNMSPMFWIFGFGDTNFQYSFFYAADSSSPDAKAFNSWPAHNGFLECLARGGLLRLIIYVSVLVYLGYRFVKKFKENKDPSIFMSLVYFAPFLIRTLVEYEYLFLDSYKGAIFALFIIVPILENNEEYEYQISFVGIKDFLIKNYRFAFLLIGSSLLSFSLLYLDIYSLSIALPLGLISFAAYVILGIKNNKNMTIWVGSFSLILVLSFSLPFGLIGNMPTMGIIFSIPFGLVVPLVGLAFYNAYLSLEINKPSLI